LLPRIYGHKFVIKIFKNWASDFLALLLGNWHYHGIQFVPNSCGWAHMLPPKYEMDMITQY